MKPDEGRLRLLENRANWGGGMNLPRPSAVPLTGAAGKPYHRSTQVSMTDATTTRYAAVLGMILVGSLATSVSRIDAQGQRPAAAASAQPTYTKYAAPILYKHCTNCHRPGEIAPMSLMTYQDARPWARAIRDN